jgi:hypothetical protein
MQLRFDDDFLEGVVFRHVGSRSHGPPLLQVRRFHRERERLYLILDPDERNAAFFKLHLEWFREWGLEKILLELVHEFPLLETGLSILVFWKARSKKDEGGELYVNAANERSGVVTLRIERFDEPQALRPFLRREFMHLHDMLDPKFGYSPHLHLDGQNPAHQRLTRERYRLLWDITVDGRLDQPSETSPPETHSRHQPEFDRAFDFWPKARRDEVFRRLCHNPSPQHLDLLAIAADPRGTKSANEPAPGAPCPLCGFATFVWAKMDQLSQETISRIQTEFLHWTPDQGACGRCGEIYGNLRPEPVATP